MSCITRIRASKSLPRYRTVRLCLTARSEYGTRRRRFKHSYALQPRACHPGNVLLTKKVSGSDDIDYNLVEFPFQIWYKDEETGSGSDGVIPGIDNTLAPGKYYLTEVTPPDGHDANEDDIIFTVFANGVVAIDSVGHSGYLSVEGTTECNYILRVPNSPNRPVELTITKTVTGAFGDKTKEFTFTLNVENAEPSDEYAWSKNGVPQAEPLRGNSTFTLRHGESVKITLPIFRRITITESNENYSTSFKLNDTAASVGNTKTFTLSGDSTLAVTNNLDAVIPTGVFHTAVGIAIIILAAFCLLAIPVILKRTQKIKG